MAQVPVPINGTIDKATTKFALHEVFYAPITHYDLHSSAARIDDHFLEVKSEHISIENRRLVLDTESVFITDASELPFHNNFNLFQNGEIELSTVEFYYDNFGNVTTHAEMVEVTSNSNNSFISTGCINVVIQESATPNGVCPNGVPNFTQAQIEVIEDVCTYLSDILCCTDNPVTFFIQPVLSASGALASGSPIYNSLQSPPDEACNNITIHPFMSSLLGEEWPTPEPNIGVISVNTCGFCPPSGGCQGYFLGEIEDYDDDNPQFDLFSVVLHEFFHAIGAGASILPDGNPINGNYAPWDLFLEINGQSLIEAEAAPPGSGCCYTYSAITSYIDESGNEVELIWPDGVVDAANAGLLSIGGVPVCNGVSAVDDSEYGLANVLSHLDEDCLENAVCSDQTTWSEYLLYSGICPGEFRRTFSPVELQLLETLGFCVQAPLNSDTPSCYVSLNDDVFVVPQWDDTDNDDETTTIQLFDNDVLPTDFTNVDFELQYCGNFTQNSQDITIEPLGGNGAYNIVGYTQGTYTFCYQIETCDGLCDIGEVTILVPSSELANCTPEDCNLFCFGDFEDFTPTGSQYFTQGGGTFYSFPNEQNTPGIHEWNGNNYAYLGINPNNGSGYGESFYMPLNSAIPPNCIITISFEADCIRTANLENYPPISPMFYASEEVICTTPTYPDGDSPFDLCMDGNLFHNMPYTTPVECEKNVLINGQNQEPVVQQISFDWTNNTGNDINYITIILPQQVINGITAVYFDNIVVTSSCNPEVSITDITSDDITVCPGKSVTLRYEICLTGDGGSTEVRLDPEILELGVATINTNATFTDGTETITLDLGNPSNPSENEDCEIVSLTIDIDEDVEFFSAISVQMDIVYENPDICNDEDDTIYSYLQIGGTPSSNFAAILDCENLVVDVTPFTEQDGNTFLWDFGDGNTSTQAAPVHTYTNNGTYTVTLTVENTCGTATSTQVINVDCTETNLDCPCPDGTDIDLVSDNVNQYTISGLVNNDIFDANVLSGKCVTIDGILTINQDYLFDNVTLIMYPGSAIIVPSGNTLITNTATFVGCTELWEGITVQDGGTIILGGGTRIQDALYAVQLLDGSTFEANDVTYNANYVGIFIPPNPNGQMNNIAFVPPFRDNTFECTSGLLPYTGNTTSLVVDDCTYAGILMHDVAWSIGYKNLYHNTFRNIYNGIRAFRSNLNANGILFSNMLYDASLANAQETGHGIYFINSFVNSNENVFERMEFGLRGNQSDLSQYQDRLSRFGVGVEMSNSPNRVISSRNSEFITYSNRAIAVYSSPQSTISILRNSINNGLAQLPQGVPEAIHINASSSAMQASETFAQVTIFDNAINLAAEQHGISLNETNNAYIGFNTVTYTSLPNQNGAWSKGVSLLRSHQNFIENNTVTAPTNFGGSGFIVSNSNTSTFCCNSAINTKQGMEFKGLDCDDTSLGVSSLVNNGGAGLSLNNAIIGGQEHAGNRWCDGSSAAFEGNPNIIDASLFTVDETDGTADCLTLPPTNAPQWFLDQLGNTPACNENGDCVVEGRASDPKTIAEAELYAARQAFTGDFSTTANWVTGLSLLRKLDIYSEDMLGRHTEIDQFYNAYSKGTMADYLELRQAMEAMRILDAATQDKLTDLQQNIRTTQEAIANLAAQIASSTHATTTSALQQESLQKQKMLREIHALYRTNLKAVRDRQADKAKDLLSQNEKLAAPHIAASNEKTMNDIILRYIAKQTSVFSPVDLERTAAIANQCPASGGAAVYTARAYYDAMLLGNQNDYDETDDCYRQSEKRLEGYTGITINTESNFYMTISPNPSTGTVQVDIPVWQGEKQIQVYDMYGRQLLQHILSDSQNQAQLDLHEHKGVLLINIQTQNGYIDTQKVIIQ